MNKIWITGKNGFIGSNILKTLSKTEKVFATSHKEIDLQDTKSVFNFIYNNNINGIIHCSVVGGGRNDIDSKEDVYTNIRMFEILNLFEKYVDFIIHFGSGAEFDRRHDINLFTEDDCLHQLPIDSYGFVKNLINRRILQSEKWYNLRLFGCFHASENNQRFIKSNILRKINNDPMIIHQDRYMDFFYLNDLIKIVIYYIKNVKYKKLPKSLNICYENKTTLYDIANFINSLTFNNNVDIICEDRSFGYNYCGNGSLLKNIIDIEYDGLYNGIREVYKNLLITTK
jgi:GDP-L-fucose synthase